MTAVNVTTVKAACNRALTTKAAVRLAFLLVTGIMVSGQLLASLWIFSVVKTTLPEAQADISALYFQLILAPLAITFLIALGLYLFVVNRYILKPLSLLKETSAQNYLERKPLSDLVKTGNIECNMIIGTFNGVLETLHYADNLATKSQLIADNLYETVDSYKKVFGEQALDNYQQEIIKYTPEQRIHIVNHLAMAMSLESMQLSFLPQIDRESEQIVAMDALVRWEDSVLGNMDPIIFLAIAEECGLIVKLTDITLYHACAAMKAWEQGAHNAAGKGCNVSINLSRKQFYDPQLISRIMNVCRRYDVSPAHFEFEIGEPILHESLPEAYQAASELCQIGARISVDHYKGDLLTQYDLNRLKISKLKMDYSFSDQERLQENHDFIEKLLDLAGQMSIEVVAVGIESYAQDKLWCNFEGPLLLQGFYYGEPVDQLSASTLLRRGIASGRSESAQAV